MLILISDKNTYNNEKGLWVCVKLASFDTEDIHHLSFLIGTHLFVMSIQRQLNIGTDKKSMGQKRKKIEILNQPKTKI